MMEIPNFHQLTRTRKSMSVLDVGIDLAKNVFAVQGVNETGVAELRQPKVARARLRELIALLPPCVIGMQACSRAHHWARLFQAHGHTVRLIAPKFVATYRMSGKQGQNDAADAAAICEAAQRPNMRRAGYRGEMPMRQQVCTVRSREFAHLRVGAEPQSRPTHPGAPQRQRSVPSWWVSP
jgi:transposase